MRRSTAARSTTAEARRPGQDNMLDATVLARLARLRTLGVNQLKAEWKNLFGTEAPNNSRPFLELRLGWRIQELAHGGPSRECVKLLDALADELCGKPGRKLTDPHKPVAGTRLVRTWNGVEHSVTVLRDGYEFDGRRYRSLSAIARAIAGTRWNGWRFFGLRGVRRDEP